MKKRILSLLLAIAIAFAMPIGIAEVQPEEWQNYQISVSDANDTQTVAMPVENAPTHAYWIKLGEQDSLEGLSLHISNMNEQGYTFYPADGTKLSGLVDANGTLEGEYLAVQVFNAQGEQIDTLLLYFSKSPAPQIEPEVIPVTVNVLYQDAMGNTVAQDTFVANTLGTNTVNANLELLPKGYTLADESSKTVELMTGGVVQPEQIVFTVEKGNVELGADVLVEYADEDGNVIVSENVTVSNLGENIINANTSLVPKGYVLDGNTSISVNLSDANIPEPNTVRFNLKKDVQEEISGTVSVIYVDTTGEYLNSEQVTINKVGTNAVSANQSMVPDGYTLEGNDSYNVELGSDGSLTPDQITFTYKKPESNENKIEPITVTVKYLDQDDPSKELQPSSSVVLNSVGEHSIDNAYPVIEGYDLVSPASVVVTVSGDNTVDKPEVVFSYKKTEVTIPKQEFKPVKITIHYIDQENKEIQPATEQTLENPGDYEIKPQYQSIDGYKLVGQGTQSLTVFDDGSASSVEIYFTYQKIETNEDSDKPSNDSENPEKPENPTENGDAQDATGKIGTVNAKSVNVRKKPSKNGDQITQLKQGTEITILEVVEDKSGQKWAKIQYGKNRTGYMLMEFIDVSQNKPTDENAPSENKVNAVLKVQYTAEDGTVLYEYESTYDKTGEYTVELRNVQETIGYEPVAETSKKIVVDEKGSIDVNPLVFQFKKMSIAANVIVHYEDLNGKSIAEPFTKTYTAAGDYTLAPEKEIAGYELVEPITYAVYVNESGVATPDDVIFKFREKTVTGKVTVEYLDAEGNKIANDTEVTLDEVGTKTVTPETIFTDYELTGESSYQVTLNADGTVVPNKVQFKYNKKDIALNAQLKIHYVDVNGNKIADDSTQSFTNEGNHDVYPNASIPADYELQGDVKQTVVLDANNVLTPSEITFTYKKIDKPIVIDAKLKVRYIDTESNSIAQDDIITLTEIGEHTIKPKLNFNEYILQNASEKVQVNPDSTVVPNEISFIYERKLPKEPTADVHIKYVDENNTPIAPDTIQTINRLGNNTVMANQTTIGDNYKIIGNGQMNVVLYQDGTAVPNPVIFVYKNTAEDFEHYIGYALSNSKVALRTSPSGDDKYIIQSLDRNTLLYISGQKKTNGILYHSVQLLNGQNGFIMDADITKITNAEADKYRREYEESKKPQNSPPVPAQTGYAMTLGNIPFRQFASGYSNIMQELYSGTVIFLNGKVEYNEGRAWYVAQYNNKLGYVRSDQVRMLSQSETENFLKNNNAVQAVETNAPQFNPNGLSSYGYVTSGNVNFRTKPNKQARIIQKINRYGMGLILETSNIGGTTWYKVNFDGKIGYVQGDYFKNMTLDEFKKFLASKEYRQGIENNLEIDNDNYTRPITKPKYDKGSASPGKLQTLEDYNAGTWRNPNIARASYEPFRPNLTPMPEVDQIEVSPTPTMIVDPSFSLDVLGESPSTSPEPSESISPNDTEPVKENTKGSSPFVFIGLLAVLGLGGAVGYAAIMKKKREKLLEAQKAKHAAAQRQGTQNRLNQSATPRDPYANPTSYGRNNFQNANKPGANQFRPGTDAFKKPSDNNAPQSVIGNEEKPNAPEESNRRRRR